MENSTNSTLELMNRAWNRTDNILLGFSITLLVADFILLGLFVHKIFLKKNDKIFGNEKTTSYLDKVITFTLILLIVQSIVCLNMISISKSVTNGFVCSINSFFFHIFHSLLKILKFFIIFLHYYIWTKQRCLGFLNVHGVLHTIFKLIFVFILSVSVIL